MSASDPNSAIYLTDSAKEIKNKHNDLVIVLALEPKADSVLATLLSSVVDSDVERPNGGNLFGDAAKALEGERNLGILRPLTNLNSAWDMNLGCGC
ncbi:conserved hypothetical protein [Ricinus communis]|uniref:Uncharacterized protein n=1 Tax=Ricinus communis TaxID=3988 RepID=B9SYS4_RICCO|nr:conserved hypothetical protein [Ricinus communis]